MIYKQFDIQLDVIKVDRTIHMENVQQINELKFNDGLDLLSGEFELIKHNIFNEKCKEWNWYEKCGKSRKPIAIGKMFLTIKKNAIKSTANRFYCGKVCRNKLPNRLNNRCCTNNTQIYPAAMLRFSNYYRGYTDKLQYVCNGYRKQRNSSKLWKVLVPFYGPRKKKQRKCDQMNYLYSCN